MLSPAQNLAATTLGHVVIAACPGSGKTTVLKFRAENLLRMEPTATLVAVTFTSDAASSLKERILKQYPSAAKRLQAGTFHKLCMEQIKRSGRKVNFMDELQIYRTIVAGIGKCPHADPSLEYDDYKQAIDEWQRDLDPDVPPAERSALGFVYRYYCEEKRRFGLMDFDDVIRDCVRGMREGTIAPIKARFMLVDEFQDTDKMQLMWVMEHVKAGTDVTIVGDDDQSIYAFRGSLGYAGMMDFQSLTQATEIKLDRTYRCSRTVIEKAANLISFNTARVQKDLNTASAEVGEVSLVSCENREAEAEKIIETIGADPANAHEWAVLARTNSQLQLLESKIGDRFAYNMKESDGFWKLDGPNRLMSLAQSIAGMNMLGVSEFLTLTGVSKSVVDKLSREIAFEEAGALDRFCGMRLPLGSNEFLEMMQRTIATWRNQVRSMSKQEMNLAINGMAAHIGKYGNWKGKRAADVQKHLHTGAKAIMSLNGPLDARLRTLTRKAAESSAGAGTSLMTFHASKGLEFEKVWIMGCDQGVIPSSREDSDVAEERRLFYVAITRAKDYLVLSKNLDNADGPSIFLSEIDGVRAHR